MSTTQQSARIKNKMQTRAAAYTARLKSATTPRQRLALAWDQWRSLARYLPETDADRLAADLFTVIDQQIKHMLTDPAPTTSK